MPDERHLAVHGDPVARVKLTDESEGVVRPGALAVAVSFRCPARPSTAPSRARPAPPPAPRSGGQGMAWRSRSSPGGASLGRGLRLRRAVAISSPTRRPAANHPRGHVDPLAGAIGVDADRLGYPVDVHLRTRSAQPTRTPRARCRATFLPSCLDLFRLHTCVNDCTRPSWAFEHRLGARVRVGGRSASAVAVTTASSASRSASAARAWRSRAAFNARVARLTCRRASASAMRAARRASALCLAAARTSAAAGFGGCGSLVAGFGFRTDFDFDFAAGLALPAGAPSVLTPSPT